MQEKLENKAAIVAPDTWVLSVRDVLTDAVLALALTLTIQSALNVRPEYLWVCAANVGAVVHSLIAFARSAKLRDVNRLALYLGYAINMAGGCTVYYTNIYVPGGVEPGDLARVVASGAGKSPFGGLFLFGKNPMEYLNECSAWMMVLGLVLASLARLGLPAPRATVGLSSCAAPAVAFLGHVQVRQMRMKVAVLGIVPLCAVNLLRAMRARQLGRAAALVTIIAAGVAIRMYFIDVGTRVSVGYFMCLNLIVWSELALSVLEQPVPVFDNWKSAKVM